MNGTPTPPTNPHEPSHPHECSEYAHVPFAYEGAEWEIDGGYLTTTVACMYSDRPHGHYECDATAYVYYEPHDDRNHAPPCPDLCERMDTEKWYTDDVVGTAGSDGAVGVSDSNDVDVPRCEPVDGDILDVGQHHVEVRGDCVHCNADVVVYYERVETGMFEA